MAKTHLVAGVDRWSKKLAETLESTDESDDVQGLPDMDFSDDEEPMQCVNCEENFVEKGAGDIDDEVMRKVVPHWNVRLQVPPEGFDYEGVFVEGPVSLIVVGHGLSSP